MKNGILAVNNIAVSGSVLISAILKNPESERNLIFIKQLNVNNIFDNSLEKDVGEISSTMKLLSLLQKLSNFK